MLKMFHTESAGGSAAFWQNAWNDGAFNEALRFCEIDPLRPLFLKHLAPGAVMLEGGCGRGQYVAYYSKRGVKVIGLDFERNALTQLKRQYPNLLLAAGDVSQLPIQSESIDVYYSGGVVEHFEAGPDPALQEARRVLRPKGLLLISVPYFSPVRKVRLLVPRKDRRSVGSPCVEEPTSGGTFFQYAFTPREFTRILRRNGFRVLSKQGYAFLWGLLEIPGVGSILAKSRPEGSTIRSSEMPGSHPQVVTYSGLRSVIKRLVVSEDATIPVAGLLIRFLRWAAANMVMYVCSTDAGDDRAQRL